MAVAVTRRKVLGMMGGAVAAAATGRRARAAEREAIRVGFIAPLSGPFAQNAKDMWDGFRMYFEEIGHQVAGRKIEVISEDSWVEPAQALTKLRQLVEKDRVHVAAGGLLAPTAFALQGYVTQQKIPFVVPIMSSDDITQRKISPWYVRPSWTTSQPAQPMGEYAYKSLGLRKVAGVNFDFAFGHESLSGFQRVFEEQGGQVIQKLWAPATVSDFAPYLPTVRKEADAIYATFSGNPALRFLKQCTEYGLKGKIAIIGLGTLTDEHVLFSMGDEALGVVTALHYSAALDTPANRRFREAYEKFAGKMPGYYSANCYTGARWIVEAVKAVGGDVENRDRFMAALKKVELADDPRGPIKLDSYGNPIQNIYIRKVERVAGKLQNSIVHTYPEVSQFWTYKPEDFLKNPVYDRDKYPGCKYCG
jgi:branched-chain amino acid transport system substrate-binding protein